RHGAGLFDVSHMGEIFVSGPGALELVQHITINDAAKLVPGKAQYSAMCYEDGGIVDDLLVYCLSDGSGDADGSDTANPEFMLVVNASNIDKDREWILRNNHAGAKVQDRSGEIALLALQGPKSVQILQKLTSADLEAIPFYSFDVSNVAGQPDVIISATGYTGEKGFELYIDTQKADPLAIWDAIMDAGAPEGLIPAGLGARDTLRLEMGYALYGNDITADTHPLESRMAWLTKLDKGPFVGRDALVAARERGVEFGLMGFVMEDERRVPRQGYDVYAAGVVGGTDSAGGTDAPLHKIGTVTSGGLSVTTGKGIGMARIRKEYAAEGTSIFIDIRGKMFLASCRKPPFIPS
ncbi:MAG: glycine cleavage system aminomethyltransferase GcvT, partial [Bacteroidetes bacterium]|nr:glycine cleavage system aminomethyltransferase GcvT [Bacteroidota bacterium]